MNQEILNKQTNKQEAAAGGLKTTGMAQLQHAILH